MTLFRHEAQIARTDRSDGDVFVYIPTSWKFFSTLIGTALVFAVVFLNTVQYARVEVALGVLLPHGDVIRVFAARDGIVADLEVVDGAEVIENQVLFNVSTDVLLESGETIGLRERAQLAVLRHQVEAQINAVNAAELERIARVKAHNHTLEERIANARELVALMTNRVSQTKEERDRLARLRLQDLVAVPQLADKDEALVNAQIELLRAERELSDLIAEISDADEIDREAAAITAGRIAALTAQRAELNGMETEIARNSGFIVRAPVTGTVTNLAVRPGQYIKSDLATMLIIPEGAPLQASLSIPANAIGFVEIGQDVHLSIDTFPAERFGIIEGRIAMVSRTSTIAEGGARFYRATVAIKRPIIHADNRDFTLQSGMTLSARIATAERSLFEWLFEPFFALARR